MHALKKKGQPGHLCTQFSFRLRFFSKDALTSMLTQLVGTVGQDNGTQESGIQPAAGSPNASLTLPVDGRERPSKSWTNSFFDVFFTEEFVDTGVNDSSIDHLFLQIAAAELAAKSPFTMNLSPHIFSKETVNEGHSAIEDLKRLIHLEQDLMFVLRFQTGGVTLVKVCFQKSRITFSGREGDRKYIVSSRKAEVKDFLMPFLPSQSREWPVVVMPSSKSWRFDVLEICTQDPPETVVGQRVWLLSHVHAKLSLGVKSDSGIKSDAVNVREVAQTLEYARRCVNDPDDCPRDFLKCEDCNSLLHLLDDPWWFLDCECRQRHHTKCGVGLFNEEVLASEICSGCNKKAEHIFVGSNRLQCRGIPISSVLGMSVSKIEDEGSCSRGSESACLRLAARLRLAGQNPQSDPETDQLKQRVL